MIPIVTTPFLPNTLPGGRATFGVSPQSEGRFGCPIAPGPAGLPSTDGPPRIYGKDSKFDERVATAIQKCEDEFCSICGATFVTSPAYLSLASFSESISPQHLRQCPFFSQGIDFPVGPDNGLRRLVATFAALFPFQKLVTDLSMKRRTTFERDLNAFAEWWEPNGGGIFAPERYGVERDQPSADDSTVDWENNSRTMVTGAQRFRIFDRDNYRCVFCGRSALEHGVILHIDHILPRSRGGTDDDSNLQTLCADDNLAKSNRSARDLRAEMALRNEAGR